MFMIVHFCSNNIFFCSYHVRCGVTHAWVTTVQQVQRPLDWEGIAALRRYSKHWGFSCISAVKEGGVAT